MSLLKQAIELHESGDKFCLAIIVAKSGSAPQVPGAKGLFMRDGGIVGTIGGGCLEMEARRLGLEAMQTGKVLHREFKLDDDFGWDDGLICGGRVQVLLIPDSSAFVPAFAKALRPGACGALVYELSSGKTTFVESSSSHECEPAKRAIQTRREVLDKGLFAEPILFPERLIIFGGGHIGREIGRLGSNLGFEVTIVDDRPEFVSEERAPWATYRICDQPEAYARSLHTDQDTYICLVTRGHRNDAKVLRELIHSERAYLGMIGSKRKREMVKKQMLAEGLCDEQAFDRVRCPMGLNIGAESVEEIAVSILAELIQTRAAKRGPLLARCGQRPLEEPMSAL